ncbi:MAG: carboxylic acid reductase [Gammaproteobacteria bacterium]
MSTTTISSGQKPSTPRERMALRAAQLTQSDPEYRAALPSKELGEAKNQPGLSLAQVMQIAMEGYAERPALGRRAREAQVDPATGERSWRFLPEFETISYREAWTRVRRLAAAWSHDPDAKIGPGDLVCIAGYPSIDDVIVDLAINYTGAVVVPLLPVAPVAQLTQVIAEAEPRWLAASVDCLDAAVQCVLGGWHPAVLLVFDVEPGDHEHAQRLDSARKRLAEADSRTRLRTLQEAIEHGARLPEPPPFTHPPGENPLANIYYTSGSTGAPKGAMYTENLALGPWRVKYPTPLICLQYLPMNHSFGRGTVAMILGNGGTSYFTARHDQSMLFEDIRLLRPTQLTLVTRICEAIFHHFQAELDRRRAQGGDPAAARAEAIAEIRDRFLGGRILAAPFGAAPISPELRAFIEECLDVKLADGYGTTEAGSVTIKTRVQRPPIIDFKLVDVPELGYFRTDKPHPRGELVVKSQSIFGGYFKRPELTASMFDADGYYKTGDIMAEVGPDQLVYVDRRNNVLKLSQGEFVAIAQLEAAYAGGHPLIRQVYLYGSSDRAYLLGVVVPNTEALAKTGQAGDPAAVKALLRNAFKEVARHENLKAYEVPRDFIVEDEPFTTENGLLAGVGKFARPALKARYGERLEKMYADIAAREMEDLNALRRGGRDRPVLETVLRAAVATLGLEEAQPDPSQGFSELGGDSLSALTLSLLLEETFDVEVPVGVIIRPGGTFADLARYIEEIRQAGASRPTVATVHGRGATEIHARDLALDKFIDALTLDEAATLAPPLTDAPRTVLLTGANGYLGRFLCLEWLERLAKTGGRLICIVRGRDAGQARQRLADGFAGGDGALTRHFETLATSHLEVLAGDLAERHLGLAAADWRRLAEHVELIVHPAALVNHVLPYEQLFGPNVVGTAELIRLAITARLKRIANVSTIAAAGMQGGTFADEESDIRVAIPSRSLSSKAYANGYACSKWAGEVLLREAHQRFGLPISVFRSDMILPHSRHPGQLNVPDIFTRLLVSLALTGLAPGSFYAEPGGAAARAHYDGLPVDFSAAAVADIGGRHARGYRTYHLLNPHDDGINLDTFVDWMMQAGVALRRVPDYADWLTRFETALRALPDEQRQRSSLALIQHLRRPERPVRGSIAPAAAFHAEVRASGVGAQRDIPHVTAEFIAKCVGDLKQLRLI